MSALDDLLQRKLEIKQKKGKFSFLTAQGDLTEAVTQSDIGKKILSSPIAQKASDIVNAPSAFIKSNVIPGIEKAIDGGSGQIGGLPGPTEGQKTIVKTALTFPLRVLASMLPNKEDALQSKEDIKTIKSLEIKANKVGGKTLEESLSPEELKRYNEAGSRLFGEQLNTMIAFSGAPIGKGAFRGMIDDSVTKLEKVLDESNPGTSNYVRAMAEQKKLSLDQYKAGLEKMVTKLGLSEKMAATEAEAARVANEVTLYHGTNADFANFEYQPPTKGAVATNFQDGPGFYLTDSSSEAAGYGKNVLQRNIDTSKFVKDDSVIDPELIKKIAQESPEFNTVLSNYDEDKQVAFEQAMEGILSEETPQAKIQALWSEFYGQSHKNFIETASKYGIDGLVVPKEGSTNYVVFNKDLLNNQSWKNTNAIAEENGVSVSNIKELVQTTSDDLSNAFYVGDQEEIPKLVAKLDSLREQVTKLGVNVNVPSSESLANSVYEIQKKEIQSVDVIGERYGNYANEIKKLVSTVKRYGEKTNALGNLNREGMASTDILASNLDKDESELMAEIVDLARKSGGIHGDTAKGGYVAVQKVIQNKFDNVYTRLAKLKKTLSPEFYVVLEDALENPKQPLSAILASPDVKTQKKIADRMAKEIERETKRQEKAIKDAPTVYQQVLNLTRAIRKATDKGIEANKMTNEQEKLIRIARKRGSVTQKELLQIIENQVGKERMSKLTKGEANQILNLMAPANRDELVGAIMHARERLFDGKEQIIKSVADPTASPRVAFMEEKYGVMTKLSGIREDVLTLFRNIKNLPPVTASSESLLAKLPFLLDKVNIEQASRILGIQDSWQIPIKNIIDLTNRLKNDLNEGIINVFKDITEEERDKVLSKVTGIKINLSPTLEARAEYLKKIFDFHFDIANKVRVASGKPAIGKKKNYLPFILDENVANLANLSDRSKFFETRTKTNKEFLAGLFTHDPERIANVFSDSAAGYLKRDLYNSLVSDRTRDLTEVSRVAYDFGNMVVNRDIYGFRQGGGFGNATLERLNKVLANVFPKKVKITQEFKYAVMNTRFGKDIEKYIKEDTLLVPRFQVDDPAGWVQTVAYTAKLAWNMSFGLINRTQPMASIPFVGIKNYLKGSLQTVSLLNPMNKEQRNLYYSILKEGGYQFGRNVNGEELKTPSGAVKIVSWLSRSANFVGDVTEYLNRTETMLGAYNYLNDLKGQTVLTDKQKFKMSVEFSNFINFVSGKGYSPLAQTSNFLNKTIYMFNTYPINQMTVYNDAVKAILKKRGMADFWKKMVSKGGVDSDVKEIFDNLPDGSKADAYKLILMVALPVATIYALTGSFEMAKRAVPGTPRPNANGLKMFTGLIDYVNNPQGDHTDFYKSIKDYFSIVSLTRLSDAYDLQTKGYLLKGTTKNPKIYKIKENDTDVIKTLLYGRSAIKPTDVSPFSFKSQSVTKPKFSFK